MAHLQFYRSYEQHAAAWDAEFARVAARFADRMHCRKGCSMCCSQMFSISPLEAAVIARAVAALPPTERERLRDRARRYVEEARVRGIVKSDEASPTVAPRPGERLTCPALEHDACAIYEARPIICRKWGIPVFDPMVPERLFSCELNFTDGEEIDAGDLVEPQHALLERWAAAKEQARAILPAGPATSTVTEAILAAVEAP